MHEWHDLEQTATQTLFGTIGNSYFKSGRSSFEMDPVTDSTTFCCCKSLIIKTKGLKKCHGITWSEIAIEGLILTVRWSVKK